MKKIITLSMLLMLTCVSYAEPFSVRIGTTDYPAVATGVKDFQERTQYLATCVHCEVNDIILCHDGGNDATWHIAALDPYGEHQKFSCTSTELKCLVAGDYDFYIKMKFEDDMWYIGEGTCGGPDPKPSNAAPAQCPDVMLQGFYWNSNNDNGFGRTKWIDLKPQAGEIGDWFDLIWLPPSSRSSGGLGYHPLQYSNLSSGLGTQQNLLDVIDSLHQHGGRVVADVVVNHCDGNSWCTFNSLNFGVYGTFQPEASWICNTDEVNTDPKAGDCQGQATGGADDGYDGEANYAASRDWDHSQQNVRDMVKAYLKWLRYTIGYDGFRYDYCKGFHMSHVNDYNTTARPYFSVLEYWDGNPSTLQARLNEAGWNTLTFDFATYYTALKDGIAAGNYARCRAAGLPGAGKARYACTFVDSHDTFQRGGDGQTDVAGTGDGSSVRTAKDKVLACNAYILSMPGIPCVFYPHWVTFKTDIKAMINARYKAGIHSESSVSDEAGNGYYKATITGTNGSIRLLLGPNSGYATTPAGYTLAAKGTNWGVYYKTNSARGDKNLNRTPRQKDTDPDITPVLETRQQSRATKVLRGGKLYLQLHDRIYDINGRLVNP